LLTEARPQAGEGVDPAKLGTIKRKDGKLQVTYNGMPLYLWVNDKAPGDTTGQNVNGVWFVVNAAGEPIR
jgi:predicted lipoprotein with Yx(FWY)xxD motif